jgi:hypothetical protein
MLTEMQYALRCIDMRHVDVAVVVPAPRYEEALRDLVALAGHEGVFGGRCLRVPHGLLTVVSVGDHFPPEPFEVMFLGWGHQPDEAGGMERWRKAASQVITRAA